MQGYAGGRQVKLLPGTKLTVLSKPTPGHHVIPAAKATVRLTEIDVIPLDLVIADGKATDVSANGPIASQVGASQPMCPYAFIWQASMNPCNEAGSIQ